MRNKIFFIILSILLSACAIKIGSKEASYPMVSLDNSDAPMEMNYSIVTLENIQKGAIIKSLEINPRKLFFKNPLLVCKRNDARRRCLGDEMSSEAVREFMLTYNRAYNTNFNTMKDVKIERRVYIVPVGSETEGVYYFISGTLLEIAGDSASAARENTIEK